MAVSAADSLSHIPGFRDRLGDRVIVPQASGALLEHLYFHDALTTAPFFGQALKDRVARLSTFSHSSYCRVRRIQHVADRGGRPALVSAHVGGRRLAEILDFAARAEMKPGTAGVLAVTRLMMAAVSLLHDFAPDGFHGALGPDRLILPGDGRVVVAEHVLGTVVEQAAAAWGVTRLWREFRLAARPAPGSAHYGRRSDVLQVGLTTLAMILGRPLGSTEYPDELGQLLHDARETNADGADIPLRPGLRGWLERTLSLGGDSSYRTLLEAQNALGQLLHDDGYKASSSAWDEFVVACESAAAKMPATVVLPGGVPVAEVKPERASAVASSTSGEGPAPAPRTDGAAATPENPDPFRSWPAATRPDGPPSLLEAFLAETPTAGVASPAEAPSLRPPAGVQPDPDLWARVPPDPVPAETLFEAPQCEPAPAVVAPTDTHPPAAAHWEGPKTPEAQTTSVADWHAPEPKVDLSHRVLYEEEQPERQTVAIDEPAEVAEAPDPNRRQRLLILALVTVTAIAAAVYAPYLWKVIYEGRRISGNVVFESDPPGAIITIDGQVRGHTPAELTLRAGDHLAELQVGGSARSMTISVKPRERLTEKMTFPEAGERGGLRISTYPTTANITIDGVPHGAAPVRVTDLMPGTHTLAVETPLGAQEQDVVVQAGRVSQLAVPTASWIKVAAPYELQVFEAGRMFGTTGSAPVMVPPGRHHFEFVNQALGLKLRQYVDAAPGQLAMVPLELPIGMMNLYSDQTAEVYVDGQKVGETPLPSLPVPLGSHEVVFRHPKYGDVRYTVSVTLVAPVQLKITFRK